MTGRIAFGGIHGGVLCRDCRRGKSHVVSVSAGVLRTMAQLADLESQTWRRMEIDARMLGELRGVLNHYIVAPRWAETEDVRLFAGVLAVEAGSREHGAGSREHGARSYEYWY